MNFPLTNAINTINFNNIYLSEQQSSFQNENSLNSSLVKKFEQMLISNDKNALDSADQHWDEKEKKYIISECVNTECRQVYAELGTYLRALYSKLHANQINSDYVLLDNKERLLTKTGKINNEKDKARVIEISAEFFWWFCEAKPVLRGNPSIAEVMLQTIWRAKGLSNPAWHKGIIPWAEVVKALDVTEFGRNFYTLFENENDAN